MGVETHECRDRSRYRSAQSRCAFLAPRVCWFRCAASADTCVCCGCEGEGPRVAPEPRAGSAAPPAPFPAQSAAQSAGDQSGSRASSPAGGLPGRTQFNLMTLHYLWQIDLLGRTEEKADTDDPAFLVAAVELAPPAGMAAAWWGGGRGLCRCSRAASSWRCTTRSA